MSGLNEHPAETNRPHASAFLFIDSQDRAQKSSLKAQTLEDFLFNYPANVQPLNDFTIQKRQPFLTGYFTRLAVTECRFEFNSPNVNPRNNKIIFTDSADVDHEITVPEGFYTPDELATALDQQLTADVLGQTWAVTYENDAFKIVSDENFTIYPYEYPVLDQTLKGLFFMMNFAIDEAIQPATTHLGGIFPNMCYTRYVDVCSRQLTQYQKVKDNSTRENQTPAVLCRIYLGNYTSEGVGSGDSTASLYFPGCRPAVIQRIWNVPKYASWNPGAFIDQIDIQLRDDIGNLLYIPGALDSEEASGQRINTIENTNEFQLTLHASES